MQYIRTINGYEIDPDAPTRKEDVERMISKCCDVFPDGLDLPEFGNYEPLFPYLTDHVDLSLCHTKAGGEINVTAVHSDTLGWHWQGVVTDDDGQVVETVRGVLDLEDIPEGSDITMDLDDLERWFTDYAEAQVRDFIRTGDTSGNDIHSQVLTSPDGLRAAEVTWREETILTNDRMPYQPITLWDEDDCPVFWDTRSNRWELVTVATPRQVNLQGSLNGNYQTFCDVGRVPGDTPNEEMPPGTYRLRWFEDKDEFIDEVVVPALEAACKEADGWSYSSYNEDCDSPVLYAGEEVEAPVVLDLDEYEMEWRASVDSSFGTRDVEELTSDLVERAKELIEAAKKDGE